MLLLLRRLLLLVPVVLALPWLLLALALVLAALIPAKVPALVQTADVGTVDGEIADNGIVARSGFGVIDLLPRVFCDLLGVSLASGRSSRGIYPAGKVTMWMACGLFLLGPMSGAGRFSDTVLCWSTRDSGR